MAFAKPLLPLLLAGLALFAPAQAKPPLPAPLPGKDKCAVCGMFVAMFPKWTCAIQFKDASIVYFDGPKDLFTYCTHMKRFNPAKGLDDIASVQVKDYLSLDPIDGQEAFYVLGSEVRGPMGTELVPFAKKIEAEAFLKAHHGTRVLGFAELTPEIVQGLE